MLPAVAKGLKPPLLAAFSQSCPRPSQSHGVAPHINSPAAPDQSVSALRAYYPGQSASRRTLLCSRRRGGACCPACARGQWPTDAGSSLLDSGLCCSQRGRRQVVGSRGRPRSWYQRGARGAACSDTCRRWRARCRRGSRRVRNRRRAGKWSRLRRRCLGQGINLQVQTWSMAVGLSWKGRGRG